ncbi:hypothetical protein ACQ7EN_02595 [Leuconostoc lactis]|uniref:hypothetical protein n=1 Tax=Leuconostoc lactis TaxID=1246 RepID=UPI003D6B626F
MSVSDAVEFYKPDAAYQNVTWHLDLVSELDFTKETCEFDTHEDAQSAWQDNIELIELKIKQLQKMLDEVSSQPIRTVVD